uniref:Lysosomal membrane ascorbate-dependent ferrireductase CYB561A3 n=1 Tax=Sinocyclocheilus grahami TaxID=75366 RepID=A0A672SC11_SINGR
MIYDETHYVCLFINASLLDIILLLCYISPLPWYNVYVPCLKTLFSFSFHLFLCVFFCFLAIVLYRVPLKWSRWWCKLTHGGLLFVAVVLSVLGVRAAFDFHTANNIPHLYSLHSWTGISTVALFTLQWFVGLCAFLLPWTPLAVRACLKPLHIWMGIAIFTLSLITSLSGINEKLLLTLNTEPYTALPAEALFANSLGILVVIFGLLVLKILSNQKWKNPEFENETDRPLLTDAR